MKRTLLLLFSIAHGFSCQSLGAGLQDIPETLGKGRSESEAVKQSPSPLPVKAVNRSEDGGIPHQTFLLTNKGDFTTIPALDAGKYEELNIFCYQGVTPSLSLFWSAAGMKLDLNNHNYEVYLANNVTGVVDLAKLRESTWFYSGLPWRSKDFKLSPFDDACVGIQTSEGYSISLHWKYVNYAMVIITAAGLTMFMMAPKLCRNTFFHYTTGISLGLLMSVVILTFLVQRRFKQSVLSWVGVAYSLAIYLMTRTWYNIKEYLTEQYFHLVIGYIFTAGLISFAVIYRMGPPSDHRTLNLITWSMQLVALCMIFLSSYHQTASLALIIAVVSWAAIPAKLKSGVNTQIRKRFFKPKIKLLSEEEYNTQAHLETKKALAELKSFCKSPESKPWQTVSRLKDPKRFAEFIEGSPHLTEGEVMEYSHWESFTDDESREEEDNGADIYTDDEEADAASDENRDF